MTTAWFQTTRKTFIHSPIPATTSTTSLLSALHDHLRIIHLNPLVINCIEIPLSINTFLASETKKYPADKVKAYRITDKIPYVGDVTYDAALIRVEDGFDSVVDAPAGLKTWARTRIVQQEGEEEAGGRVLKEETELQGNWFLMPFVMWNFEGSHRESQGKFLKRLEEADGVAGGATGS